ncbi:preprotein translocase subunit SecG [Maribacter sp. 2-571]|uniref:preprotein translocase subunit SecG n=1 Tax=Maribacter sp. 2-571 TaxID=3417569 RepID=UPI003D328D9F
MSTFTIFLVLIIVVCFLLVLVIMVQNPKGGGLSSSFGGGGSQVVGGVKKTGDFLDKSTWTLAGLLVILILASNIALPGKFGGESDSKILNGDEIETTVPETIPEAAPDALPTPAGEDAVPGDSAQ